METNNQPMAGAGVDIDIMSQHPMPLVEAEKEARIERRRAERERAEAMFLSELMTSTDAPEMLRRLIKDLFVDIRALFSGETIPDDCTDLVVMIRTRLKIMHDTLVKNTNLHDEATRYGLMSIVGGMLHTDIPPKPEVVNG